MRTETNKGQTWNENIWTVTRSKETSPS